MKRVIVTVLGLSPQVLTESLYALFMEGKMVNEVHVITTTTGRDLVHAGLLASGQGQFFKFLEEYDIPNGVIDFPPDNIHVLKDENGMELDDIVSPSDNEILLRKCLELGWKLTLDPDQAVYFMIAGGRKTMSACLALAAQFYGRSHDRIYHVLVSPEFEECRDFYFPPRNPRLIATRDRKGNICYRNTKDAEIWLVQLPFVSVRDRLLDEDLDEPKTPEELMASLIRDNPPKLVIDLRAGRMSFRGREADLPATQLALLAFFTMMKKECGCTKEQECRRCFLSWEEIEGDQQYLDKIKDLYKHSCVD